MAREHNPLLGNGEKLTHQLNIDSGGGPKNPPYALDYARARLRQPLEALSAWAESLPAAACPGDEAVFTITLHPRYISKSAQPTDFLSAAGFSAIGRRERTISPEKWGIEKHPASAPTDQLFVRGTRRNIVRLATDMMSWQDRSPSAKELTQIERIEAFTGVDKVISLPESARLMTEVVLHNAGSAEIVNHFARYAESLQARVLNDRKKVIGLLTFLPVELQTSNAIAIADFSFVRVLRAMPTLRPVSEPILRNAASKTISLPTQGPLSQTRTVVFDGGLSPDAQAMLRPWVTYFEPDGLGMAVPAYQAHGLAVTSSLLFGPMSEKSLLSQPYGPIDHVRVLDARTGGEQDIEYYDVLDRILFHLRTAEPYQFGCLSIGPQRAITDDEVTAWTAALDVQLCHGNMVMAVAAGNDGELEAELGLNRLQPPSDGVNVLCVGASDSMGRKWARASYSCVGPGRRPGVFKPDGLAFGGTAERPFGVLAESGQIARVTGTSFAAPYALRSGVGVASVLEDAIHPLTIRALMIHRAEGRARLKHAEAGWGRFDHDVANLLTSEDDEAVVVYEGSLPLTETLRAGITLPNIPLTGKIDITATLAVSPEVDVEHASTYTRAGIEAQFRPHKEHFTTYKDGKTSSQPTAESFFTGGRLFKRTPEFVRRADGHKWEPILRSTRSFDAGDLLSPCFDLYYHHRERGHAHTEPQPIRYALIVSVKARNHPNFYQEVLRSYPVLIPLRQRIELRV